MDKSANYDLRKITWFLLLVNFFYGVCLAMLLPPWGLYDEQQHFDYALRLSMSMGPPNVNGTFLLDSVAESVFESDRWSKYGWTRPQTAEPTTWGKEGLSYQGHHPPLFYYLSSWILRALSDLSILSQLFVLRIISVVVSTMTVFVYCRTLTLLNLNGWVAFFALASLVIVPNRIVVLANFSNSVLAEFIGASLLYVAAQIYLVGPNVKRTLLVGFLLGCAASTRVTTVLLLLPVVVAYLRHWNATTFWRYGVIFLLSFVLWVATNRGFFLSLLGAGNQGDTIALLKQFGTFDQGILRSLAVTLSTIVYTGDLYFFMGLFSKQSIAYLLPWALVVMIILWKLWMTPRPSNPLGTLPTNWAKALVSTYVCAFGLLQFVVVFSLLPSGDARILLPYFGALAIPVILVLARPWHQKLTSAALGLTILNSVAYVAYGLLFKLYGRAIDTDMGETRIVAVFADKPEWAFSVVMLMFACLTVTLIKASIWCFNKGRP